MTYGTEGTYDTRLPQGGTRTAEEYIQQMQKAYNARTLAEMLEEKIVGYKIEEEKNV